MSDLKTIGIGILLALVGVPLIQILSAKFLDQNEHKPVSQSIIQVSNIEGLFGLLLIIFSVGFSVHDSLPMNSHLFLSVGVLSGVVWIFLSGCIREGNSIARKILHLLLVVRCFTLVGLIFSGPSLFLLNKEAKQN